MSHFFIKFVSELAKSSFGSVKTLLSQKGFIQMGFCFINVSFPPAKKILNLYKPSNFFFPFSSLTNIKENKTLFVCFLYLIGDYFFSSLVVLQVKKAADTLLATVQGGFFLFFHKTLHCASFL